MIIGWPSKQSSNGNNSACTIFVLFWGLLSSILPKAPQNGSKLQFYVTRYFCVKLKKSRLPPKMEITMNFLSWFFTEFIPSWCIYQFITIKTVGHFRGWVGGSDQILISVNLSLNLNHKKLSEFITTWHIYPYNPGSSSELYVWGERPTPVSLFVLQYQILSWRTLPGVTIFIFHTTFNLILFEKLHTLTHTHLICLLIQSIKFIWFGFLHIYW